MPATPLSSLNTVTKNMQRAKQQFIADVLDTDKPTIYRADDYRTMRGLIYNNVLKSVQKRFPLYNDKYVLTVQNLSYADPQEVSYADQKKAVMQGKSVGRRLRGQYVLRKADTDQVVSKTAPQTLMKVPYITDRGTFINNGHQYTFNNIMRLEPGVYTKKNSDDQITAQFNVKKGTGAGFNMRFIPSKGLFQVSRGTANAPAYTVMRDLGATDQQLKQAWGPELFQTNRTAGTGAKARLAADKIYNYRNT